MTAIHQGISIGQPSYDKTCMEWYMGRIPLISWYFIAISKSVESAFPVYMVYKRSSSTLNTTHVNVLDCAGYILRVLYCVSCSVFMHTAHVLLSLPKPLYTTTVTLHRHDTAAEKMSYHLHPCKNYPYNWLRSDQRVGQKLPKKDQTLGLKVGYGYFPVLKIRIWGTYD